ncbi:MAG: hypothetical protein ACPLZD_08875 [Candidatus Saccharicenans sp.]
MSTIDFNFEVKVKSAYEALSQAINLFRIYLDEKTPATGAEYYRAKSLLKEGRLFFEEVMKEAKKLLGPLPPYATPEYSEWREETAKGLKLIVEDKATYDDFKNRLLSDSFLTKLFSAEELEAYLHKYFEQQRKGKRKLENLKCRLLIARLNDLLDQAENLLPEAQKKLQSSIF